MPNSAPILDENFTSELDAFGRSINVEALKFDDIMKVFVNYVRTVLFSIQELSQHIIPIEVQLKLEGILSEAETFVGGQVVAQQTSDLRVRAWKLHDALPVGSQSRRLAEVVVLCCYDSESAEFDTFGPEPMIESIMTSLARLARGQCRSFRIFAMSRLAND